TKKGYVFNDGIISYSKSKYNKIDFDSSVSSFYTSKKLYDAGYPIILSQLVKEMNYINWNSLRNLFDEKIKLLLNSTKRKLCSSSLKYNNKTFQIFGVDFVVTNSMDTRILEVNVGPGMEPYCDIDKKMRIKLHQDMLLIVGVVNKHPSDPKLSNGFRKMWEK
ncbi:MAG: hypothetical protein GTN36_06600, partial [Candidatus Aenigmarchaeota archaeon]|nr:hypothetical protein [Candidatus Aenigmarchaeota archaeon]